MAAAVIDTVEILTQVVEAAAGIAGVITSFKMLSLAKKYYNLYKNQREFYYDTFQTGLEAPLATEVYGIPVYTLDWGGQIGSIYDGETGAFGESTDAEAWWARHGAAYSTVNDSRLLKELPFDKVKVKSDWTNYLARFEEQFADITNDIRWRKRFALHNIGIKQGTAVAASLDSSLDNYMEHVNDFGNQLATYGNGIAKYVGYRKGLADTADDFNRMDYRQRTPSSIPDYNYTQVGAVA